MSRKLNQWAQENVRKSGKTYQKTNKGIYIFNKGQKEPEDFFKDWDEYVSYHANTNDLHELSKYEPRKHHLRRN